MRKRASRMLAIGIVWMTVLGTASASLAADNFQNSTVLIQVEPSGYPTSVAPSQKWFAPGDSIDITIRVGGDADGLEDVFDIMIFKDGETTFHENVGLFDDIAVSPANGRATVTYSSTKTLALPDGDYDVYVGDDMWIEDGGFDSGRSNYDWTWFCIQMYIIKAGSDREGYLPGDVVNVSYSVVSIMDGMLIDEGQIPGLAFHDKQWWAWSEDGFSSEGPNSLSESSGYFNYMISAAGGVWPYDYIIGICFNGTFAAERQACTFLFGNMPDEVFRVDTIAINLQTDKGTYQIGENATVEVGVGVNGTASPVQDAEVDIVILRGVGLGAIPISGYGDLFLTDSAGNVTYEFNVSESDFAGGENYTVRATVNKHMEEALKEVTFSVLDVPVQEEDFDNDGLPDSMDPDDDNDGYSDVIEQQEGSDPKNRHSKPLDNDGDYDPDSTDPDDDNDGYSDIEELEAGSDPMDPWSVPLYEEPRPDNSWMWFVPVIAGVVGLVISLALLIWAVRPPKGGWETSRAPDLYEYGRMRKK